MRPGVSTGAYTILAPRQLVRAVPEALRANSASMVPWTGLSGVPTGFADGIDNIGGVGSVTSVSAGIGLSGGVITGSGTLGIASGGVGSIEIADSSIAAVDIATDAVTAAKLADAAVDTNAVQNLAITQGKIGTAAVGAGQIDSSQVQRRVNGSCFLGSYLRGLNADGSVLCSDLPGVDIPTHEKPQFRRMGSHYSGSWEASFLNSDSESWEAS